MKVALVAWFLMPFDRQRQLTANGYAHAIPTVLKMEFEGGNRTEISFLNSIFAIMFSQWSIFLIIPCHWQVGENKAAHVWGWHSSKNCAAVIILAGAKRKYFLSSAQGFLRNITLQFHLKGWITIPGFSSKTKMEFDRLVLPPPPRPPAL